MKLWDGRPTPGRAVTTGLLAVTLVLVNAAPAFAFGVLTQWGSSGSDPGEFNDGPYGIDVTPDGAVYVDECTNHRVQQFKADGSFVRQWGSFGTGDGEFSCPDALAVNPANGDVYISEDGNHRVQQSSATGTYIRKWGANGGDGTSGTDPGEFDGPSGIAVGNGSVYVGEEGANPRIQQFTLDGQFIREWGTAGLGNGEFSRVLGIAVGPAGDVYVADNDNNRIQQFSPTGTFIRKWGKNGGDGTPGTGDGEFDGPIGIAIDSVGNVWAIDGESRLQTFSSTGVFISKFGTEGTGLGQFSSPEDIAIDCRGNVYVSDYGNDRIVKLGELGAGDPPCPPAATPPVTPPTALIDTTLPIQRLLFDKTQHLDSLSIFVQVSEDSALVGTGTLSIPKGAAKRIKFKQVRRAALANVGVQLRFRLSRKRNKAALAALRKRPRLKVRIKVKATDIAGNAATKTIRLKVKR